MNRLFLSLTYFLFCFILFCKIGLPNRGKSFDGYKAEIILLGKEKKFDGALRLLEESKTKFPEERKFQASIYYHAADGYYGEGKLDKALPILEKVSEEYPLENKIWALYARTLLKSGNREKSFEILEKFPKDFRNFEEDLMKTTLDIWSTYNLAACYALLGKPDLAVLYLNTLLSAQGFEPKSSFSHVIEDPDFDSIRGDQRYVFLVDRVFADNFDDVVVVVEKELRKVREAVRKFFHREALPAESLRILRQSKRSVNEIYTVAPVLIEIQNQVIDYIDSAGKTVLVDHKLLPASSLENLEEEYRKIIEALEAAKASQQSNDKRVP